MQPYLQNKSFSAPTFGSGVVSRAFACGGHRYGFGGKEKESEAGGFDYDFGARVYDSRIARWLAVDLLAIKYPEASPCNFALNTPIQAKDPDGRVVIFVNGMWGTGTGASHGGQAQHWGLSWIGKAQKQIGDNKARFYDGSSDWTGNVGGMSRVSWNMDPANRYKSGYMQGKKDAADIVNSLEKSPDGKIAESIKFVTSSMGAAYSRGMSQAIVDYVANQNQQIDAYNASLEKNIDGTYKDPSLVKQRLEVTIEFTVDLDAFQSKRVKADPNSNKNYYMKSDGWETNFLGGEDVPGSTEITNSQGGANMEHHHPSWAPAGDLPKGTMNPIGSSTIENPTK